MTDVIELKIDGMSCMHCVNAVHKALAAVPGVEDVLEVNLETGSATVSGKPDTAALIDAVKAAGYQAVV